jgi:hypothetical protein
MFGMAFVLGVVEPLIVILDLFLLDFFKSMMNGLEDDAPMELYVAKGLILEPGGCVLF